MAVCSSVRRLSTGLLQSRIDRLALERENTKRALVNSPKRLATNKSLECLDAERELAQCE